MKKILSIVGANLLIAGGLSARASWMILSGCDISGTCRGTSNMLTWGLAIGPAVILLIVLGLSAPMLWRALAERRVVRQEMAAEKAEASAAADDVAEHGQNRLARLKRPHDDDITVGDPMAMGMGDAAPDADAWPDHTAIADDVDPVALSEFGITGDAATDALGDAVADADEIEREWLAAEAAMHPSANDFMAEPMVDADLPMDLTPQYRPAIDEASSDDHAISDATNDDHAADLAPYDAPAESISTDFRLMPLSFDADFDDANVDDDDAMDSESAVEALPATLADETPPHTPSTPEPLGTATGWRIEPVETSISSTIADGQNWNHAPVEPTLPAATASVDIWGRLGEAGIDQPTDLNDDGIAVANDALPPIDLPTIGRASDEWAWLFADGLPLLRTSRATGFPWIAGGIGEVAAAFRATLALDYIGNAAAEVDAWVQIARSMPYAELLAPEDAQAFVEWCNTLSVDLSGSPQQQDLVWAITTAMSALRGRARSDMETSLALPDAFDQSFPGAGFGHSLSA